MIVSSPLNRKVRYEREAAAAAVVAAGLRTCAVLHIEGVASRGDLLRPRVVALEPVAPGRGDRSLAWLVAPERRWPELRLREADGIGQGASPVRVARELAQAAHGKRLYADPHMDACDWLFTLYRELGLDRPPFPVRDLRRMLAFLGPEPTGPEGLSPPLPAISAAVGEAARGAALLRATRPAELADVVPLRAPASPQQ